MFFAFVLIFVAICFCIVFVVHVFNPFQHGKNGFFCTELNFRLGKICDKSVALNTGLKCLFECLRAIAARGGLLLGKEAEQKRFCWSACLPSSGMCWCCAIVTDILKDRRLRQRVWFHTSACLRRFVNRSWKAQFHMLQSSFFARFAAVPAPHILKEIVEV